VIAVGYRAPQQATGTANVAAPVTSAVNENAPTVDAVVAASVAADIAQSANLPIATKALNLSISIQIENELSQSDSSIISKPQISQPSAATRSIATHTVVEGETVASIAARYNVTTDTIKWANNLTTDTVAAGRTLEILPVSGVVYTVKSGDSIQSIAEKYKADASRITVYNDLEASGINPGLRIVIPSGNLPTNERPGYVAPRSYSFIGGSVGNRYDFGYCTWYVYEQRAKAGKPVGSFWSHAKYWDDGARSSGYLVNNVPEAGAVFQTDAFGGGYGHVAIVERKNADGSITISEMNYAGWNVVSSRTIPAEQVGLYRYIH